MNEGYTEFSRKLERKYFYDPILEEERPNVLKQVICNVPVENLFNGSRCESESYINLKTRQIVFFTMMRLQMQIAFAYLI